MTLIAFIGGPLDGRKVEFFTENPPPRAVYGSSVYKRLDDPITGEFLGGYVYKEHEVWPSPTPFPDLPSVDFASGSAPWLTRVIRWMRMTTRRCR